MHRGTIESSSNALCNWLTPVIHLAGIITYTFGTLGCDSEMCSSRGNVEWKWSKTQQIPWFYSLTLLKFLSLQPLLDNFIIIFVVTIKGSEIIWCVGNNCNDFCFIFKLEHLRNVTYF